MTLSSGEEEVDRGGGDVSKRSLVLDPLTVRSYEPGKALEVQYEIHICRMNVKYRV